MTTPLHDAQIEQIKRDAKRRAQSLNIPLHQAQAYFANEYGYANWSLLMKHRATAGAPAAPTEPPFLFSRSHEQMREAVRLLPHKTLNSDRWELARDRITDISGKFVSVSNAIDFAISYMECLLALPRTRVNSQTCAYWEMRCWLPYCLHPVDDADDLGAAPQILLARHYKPVGFLIPEGGRYVTYADYPRLHVALPAHLLTKITRPDCEIGYLYHDGCPPWEGKREARAYLAHLRLVRTFL